MSGAGLVRQSDIPTLPWVTLAGREPAATLEES